MADPPPSRNKSPISECCRCAACVGQKQCAPTNPGPPCFLKIGKPPPATSLRRNSGSPPAPHCVPPTLPPLLRVAQYLRRADCSKPLPIMFKQPTPPRQLYK